MIDLDRHIPPTGLRKDEMGTADRKVLWVSREYAMELLSVARDERWKLNTSHSQLNLRMILGFVLGLAVGIAATLGALDGAGKRCHSQCVELGNPTAVIQ